MELSHRVRGGVEVGEWGVFKRKKAEWRASGWHKTVL